VAQTYSWNDVLTLTGKLYKGIPISSVTPLICDMVSSKMWNRAMWKERVANIPATSIPLVSGTQDYSVPTNICSLLRARICRTDVTPNEYYPIDGFQIKEHLEPNLVSRGYPSILSISHESDLGKFRLEAAPYIPSTTTLYLQGEYELNPTKVSATSQSCWFQDQYVDVAVKGVAHFGYRIADDPRAGQLQKVEGGKSAYTGMLGEFMAALDDMAADQDFGALPQLSPTDSIGADTSSPGLRLYP
jgi:hypothetical protein